MTTLFWNAKRPGLGSAATAGFFPSFQCSRIRNMEREKQLVAVKRQLSLSDRAAVPFVARFTRCQDRSGRRHGCYSESLRRSDTRALLLLEAPPEVSALAVRSVGNPRQHKCHILNRFYPCTVARYSLRLRLHSMSACFPGDPLSVVCGCAVARSACRASGTPVARE